jgi:hypothetical protein
LEGGLLFRQSGLVLILLSVRELLRPPEVLVLRIDRRVPRGTSGKWVQPVVSEQLLAVFDVPQRNRARLLAPHHNAGQLLQDHNGPCA